jgi:hypothetical protein
MDNCQVNSLKSLNLNKLHFNLTDIFNDPIESKQSHSPSSDLKNFFPLRPKEFVSFPSGTDSSPLTLSLVTVGIVLDLMLTGPQADQDQR